MRFFKSAMLGMTLAVSIMATSASAAKVHVFHLKTGGTLTGEIIDQSAESAKGPDWLVIRTANGSEHKILRRSLKFNPQLAGSSDVYYRQRARKVADNAGAHIELAKWCEKQERGSIRFAEEIRWHFEQAVRFDHDNRLAREKLGFMKLRDGTWVVEDQFVASHGYVEIKKRWVAKIGAELIARNKQDPRRTDNKKFASWIRDVKRGRFSEAELTAKLVDVIEPWMVLELDKIVNDEKRPVNKSFKRIAMDGIATLNHPVALNGLISFALLDDDNDIRDRALDLLSQPQFNHNFIVSRLATKLNSELNVTVRRAALAIGEISATDDYSRDVILLPLSEALITTHKVPTGNLEEGRLSTGFGNGGAGLQTGGGPTEVDRDFRNTQALDALRRLTEVDFGYDEQRWANWFIENHTRRDLLVGEDD